jgi:hypothetical protein
MRLRRSLLPLLFLAPPPAEALRFLCLHGGGQAPSSFQYQMQALTNALGSGHTFVYAQGPYATNLWISDPPGGKGQPTTDPDFAINSFNVLDNLVSTQGPFDAIMGYSQGAAFTNVYLSQASALGTFRFAVTFCSYLPVIYVTLDRKLQPNGTPQ